MRASVRPSTPAAASEKRRLGRSLFDPTQLLTLAMFTAVVAFSTITRLDPDLWGHVRFGRDIVTAGAVMRSDPYSFTSDRPWVNHEWLAEVLMYGAYAAAGPSGLIALKAAILVALVALVAWASQPWSPPPVAFQFLVLWTVVAALPWAVMVRPQLFSFLLFTLLLILLTEADRGQWPGLVAVPVLMAFWVNVHGGWIVGIGTLGLWIAFG